ncbi:MAG TPA: M67 family metallopeptidase [Acidimicrobiales bacterium]|nr:M67 family metallopeptidase [Acidimicrobiales bacterium]
MLVLAETLWERMVAHCLACLPMEGCGLIAGLEPAGPTGGPADAEAGSQSLAQALEVYPATNAAASARLYTVEPRDLLRADRAAEAAGMQLIGVWHSHTHTPAYPSPTDVRQAPDPSWHYVLVSLSEDEPAVRSYRIRDGLVQEEEVRLAPEHWGS